MDGMTGRIGSEGRKDVSGEYYVVFYVILTLT